ncbi:hypothetical protein CD175_03450 [Pseudomonas laurylsulfatiphila]|uniref:Uncharacterized protein n=1 Tax=Pseudomonas laurylsulfatiphila TaxID=2011015 RepID=A0A2S6FSZ4_9PSED|nr:hypothetical protein CD175_03450 [Pseudomonas laurylsulfatiphila]
MWERACSRKRCVRQYRCRLTHRFREQARSHRVLRCFSKVPEPTARCGRNRLRIRCRTAP